MREIKFRGKCFKNGEFVYGSFLPDVLEGLNDLVSWGFIRNYNKETGHMQTIEVDRETVGQYTGLKDKNGVEIYEGDIIKAWSQGLNATGQVVHRIDGLWIMYPAYQKQIMWGLMPDGDGTTTVEIIGNMHDNPELLGERK